MEGSNQRLSLSGLDQSWVCHRCSTKHERKRNDHSQVLLFNAHFALLKTLQDGGHGRGAAGGPGHRGEQCGPE